MSNFSLTIHFNSLDELINFSNAYQKFNIKAEIKTNNKSFLIIFKFTKKTIPSNQLQILLSKT